MIIFPPLSVSPPPIPEEWVFPTTVKLPRFLLSSSVRRSPFFSVSPFSRVTSLGIFPFSGTINSPSISLFTTESSIIRVVLFPALIPG